MLYTVMLRRAIDHTRNGVLDLEENMKKSSKGRSRIQRCAFNIEQSLMASDMEDLKRKLAKLRKRLALVKSLVTK